MNRLAILPILAALVLLPASAQAQSLLRAFSSPHAEPSARFGDALSGIPDVDGDGRGDLIVGSPLEEGETSPQNAGLAYVFSGASGDLLRTLASPNEEADGHFGRAVSGVPDVDGDGSADFLVGADGEDPGPSDAGRVYVFSGATGALLYSLASFAPSSEGRFGAAVAGVPDLDGDEWGDLLVGAYGEESAYVFSGATGAPLYALVSPLGGGLFGYAVAGVSDLDDDGAGDLLVGAYSEEFSGRAFVFSGATGALLYALAPPDIGGRAQFGYAVSATPDADGDGVADLLVGADLGFAAPSPQQAGRAYLFSGATGALLHALVSPDEQLRGYFGHAVTGVPDVDGDGRGELLVGAYGEDYHGNSADEVGRAYLYSGASGRLIGAVKSPSLEPRGWFGFSAAGMDDVDGDGRGDFLAGASYAFQSGRAYLFSGTPSVLLAATLLHNPIPRGGRLQFEVAVTNLTPHRLVGDLTLDISGPGGAQYSRVLVTGRTLEGNTTRTPSFALRVPSDAALGKYTATVKAREGGGLTLTRTEVTFPFEVVASARVAEGVAPSHAFGVEGAHGDRATTADQNRLAASASPNPVDGRTAVAFALDAPAAVRLALYDVLGREVAAVEAGRLERGPHRLVLDLSRLPAGVYVWRLVVDGQAETGRLTVAR